MAPPRDAGNPTADPGRRLAVARGVPPQPAEPTARSPPNSPHLPVSRARQPSACSEASSEPGLTGWRWGMDDRVQRVHEQIDRDRLRRHSNRVLHGHPSPTLWDEPDVPVDEILNGGAIQNPGMALRSTHHIPRPRPRPPRRKRPSRARSARARRASSRERPDSATSSPRATLPRAAAISIAAREITARPAGGRRAAELGSRVRVRVRALVARDRAASPLSRALPACPSPKPGRPASG